MRTDDDQGDVTIPPLIACHEGSVPCVHYVIVCHDVCLKPQFWDCKGFFGPRNRVRHGRR